jgi:hypothetical protein
MDERMLNLNRQEQALTQGQPQGKRILARAVQIEEVTAQPEQPSPGSPARENPPAAAETAAPVDPQVVAQRVLELMRRDLRIERERRKPGR